MHRGHLRRDRNGTNPLWGVLLNATDRKRSPRVDLAIREENVGGVHMPSAVSFVEDIDWRFRGDCSLWERFQAVFLDILLRQEQGLNALVVVRISTLEETYPHARTVRTGREPTTGKGEAYRTQCNIGIATQACRDPKKQEVQ